MNLLLGTSAVRCFCFVYVIIAKFYLVNEFTIKILNRYNDDVNNIRHEYL